MAWPVLTHFSHIRRSSRAPSRRRSRCLRGMRAPLVRCILARALGTRRGGRAEGEGEGGREGKGQRTGQGQGKRDTGKELAAPDGKVEMDWAHRQQQQPLLYSTLHSQHSQHSNCRRSTAVGSGHPASERGFGRAGARRPPIPNIVAHRLDGSRAAGRHLGRMAADDCGGPLKTRTGGLQSGRQVQVQVQVCTGAGALSKFRSRGHTTGESYDVRRVKEGATGVCLTCRARQARAMRGGRRRGSRATGERAWAAMLEGGRALGCLSRVRACRGCLVYGARDVERVERRADASTQARRGTSRPKPRLWAPVTQAHDPADLASRLVGSALDTGQSWE